MAAIRCRWAKGFLCLSMALLALSVPVKAAPTINGMEFSAPPIVAAPIRGLTPAEAWKTLRSGITVRWNAQWPVGRVWVRYMGAGLAWYAFEPMPSGRVLGFGWVFTGGNLAGVSDWEIVDEEPNADGK